MSRLLLLAVTAQTPNPGPSPGAGRPPRPCKLHGPRPRPWASLTSPSGKRVPATRPRVRGNPADPWHLPPTEATGPAHPPPPASRPLSASENRLLSQEQRADSFPGLRGYNADCKRDSGESQGSREAPGSAPQGSADGGGAEGITSEALTSISYIGGPRMSLRAWRSIRIGISGGRARLAAPLSPMGWDSASSERSLPPARGSCSETLALAAGERAPRTAEPGTHGPVLVQLESAPSRRHSQAPTGQPSSSWRACPADGRASLVNAIILKTSETPWPVWLSG